MRINTEFCKGRNNLMSADMQHGMMAGVAGGVLCWIGINVLIFGENSVFGAAILLIWLVFMICGIVHFSQGG